MSCGTITLRVVGIPFPSLREKIIGPIFKDQEIQKGKSIEKNF
jgi:hypothetical protein